MQSQASFVKGMGGKVRVASTRAKDTGLAIRGVLDEIEADDAALVLVFFALGYDAEVIARELEAATGDRGIGGSTAGEISELGFTDDGMTAISVSADAARASVNVVTSLSDISLVALSSIPSDLARRIGRSVDDLDPNHHVWMMLQDGLSGREDLITPFFARNCLNAPLVGGSLAGGRDFQGDVQLVHDGKIYKDAAAIMLLEYDRQLSIIHHTHHEFTDHWFEVTRVASGGRVIQELDGRPVREVYAEALGCAADEIDTGITGRHPLGVRFRGKPFPCSIMRPLEEGFYMAYSVQRGERLALLEPVDMVEKSRRAIRSGIEELEQYNASPQAILLFHCLGRYLESEELDVKDELFAALHQAPLCGLNTLGEQYLSMHMNHSMTGVIFG